MISKLESFLQELADLSGNDHDPIGPTIQAFVNRSAFVFSQIRDAAIALMKMHGDVDPDFTNTAGQLFSFVCDRCAAATWLLQGGFVWDAGILARSISEATCKILFLSFTSAAERESRIEDFWDRLADIRKLRVSERIKNYIQFQKDFGSTDSFFWQSLQVLTEEEEAQIRSRSSRVERKKLEQKWSFFEMLNSIDVYRSAIKMPPLSAGFVLGYGRNSNFIHADEHALMAAYDYVNRQPDEKIKLRSLHVVMHLENNLTCAAGCLLALGHVYGTDSPNLKELGILMKTLFDDWSIVKAEFEDSQQKFAESIRRGEVHVDI